MLTFILWVSLVLQKIESSGLDSGGTLPGYCPHFIRDPLKEPQLVMYDFVLLMCAYVHICQRSASELFF